MTHGAGRTSGYRGIESHIRVKSMKEKANNRDQQNNADKLYRDIFLWMLQGFTSVDVVSPPTIKS
ncbi:MAG: hypothetical protein C5B53_07250 [Candidatus Melainabacteria bacterium]|nr:MAG: hypothetical protein C5B53_07250 [Candidatus Melainabacteria bacterium]